MRILYIKHQAPMLVTAATEALVPDLEAMGHRVIRVDPHAMARLFGHDAAQQMILRFARAYQVHLAITNPPYDLLMPQTGRDLQAMGIPVIAWRYDDALHLSFLQRQPDDIWRYLKTAPERYTIQTTTSRKALALMTELGVDNAVYLRLACSTARVADERSMPEVAVSFFGKAYPEDDRGSARISTLKHIAAAGLPLAIWGLDWEKVPELAAHWHDVLPFQHLGSLIRASQINLNTNGWVAPMIKLRLLEIALAGGFQLVDACEELSDYFHLGQEVVETRNLDDLTAKIRHYLAHPEERQAIAAAGQARALREHTWHARWPEMLAALGERWPHPLSDDDDPKRVDEAHVEPVMLALLGLAHAYEAEGNASFARWYFAEALRLRPRDVGALAGLGRLSKAAGDLESSWEYWHKVAELSPPQGFTWNDSRGALPQKGAGEFHERDPHREAAVQLGRIAEAQGHGVRFRELLPALAWADWNHTKAIADRMLAQGHWAVAGQTYEALAREAPDHPEIALGMAKALVELNRPHDALPILFRLDARYPGNPEVQAALDRALSPPSA